MAATPFICYRQNAFQQHLQHDLYLAMATAISAFAFRRPRQTPLRKRLQMQPAKAKDQTIF